MKTLNAVCLTESATPLHWPANSHDLNPIKQVWEMENDLMDSATFVRNGSSKGKRLCLPSPAIPCAGWLRTLPSVSALLWG
jgi:hypothetical protein